MQPIASLDIRGVSRSFGRSFALHRVSMTLQAGTVTALLGGNGAGKSTLLNILATLDAPSEGEILYGGVPFRRFAQSGRQHIGWVSHDTLVYGELTGRENLAFFARMYGLREAPRLVQGWLERVGLAGDAERRVDTYSRGMRQRLTLARAMLHDPALVLLDEPTTGLDPTGARQMADLLRELRAEGRLVVLITHDLNVLEGAVDCAAVLRRGKLVHFGPAQSAADLWSAYEAHAG